MQSRLFEVDPMAGVGYAMYNSVKKGEGSFEDFLLHYDSVKVNEGDDDWLTKLINEDSLFQVTSPQMLEAMNKYGVNSLDILSKSNYFDTQVESYKLQLMQEMSKRKITPPPTQTLYM